MLNVLGDGGLERTEATIEVTKLPQREKIAKIPRRISASVAKKATA